MCLCTINKTEAHQIQLKAHRCCNCTQTCWLTGTVSTTGTQGDWKRTFIDLLNRFPILLLISGLAFSMLQYACQIKCCFHLCCGPCRNGTLGRHLRSLRLPCVQLLGAVLGMRHCRVPESLLKMQLQSAKLAVKLLFKTGISAISEILLKIAETLGNTTQLFPQSIAQPCLGSCLPFCQEPSSPTEKQHS